MNLYIYVLCLENQKNLSDFYHTNNNVLIYQNLVNGPRKNQVLYEFILKMK